MLIKLRRWNKWYSWFEYRHYTNERANELGLKPHNLDIAFLGYSIWICW